MTQELTQRGMLELAFQEGVVLEWYLDSANVGSWGLGVTNASGIDVRKYKDKPAPLQECLDVACALLDSKYVPDVRRAFGSYKLSEAQLTAAVSFHWNTGAILRATWVQLVIKGDYVGARKSFMLWKNPPEIVERRTREAELFFDNVWSNNGKVPVFPVRKPSYQPDFSKGKLVALGGK